jgi:hypothetical protein
MTARDLAARRQLLVANATLQRLRLAHDVDDLRLACRPPRGTGVALGVAALAAAWWARQSQRRAALPHTAATTAASVWALRGLTLWRAVSALRRVWLAARPQQH